MSVTEQLEWLVRIIDKNKGEHINVIDISDLSSVADYFVIATALNRMHAQAIERHIDKDFKEKFAIRPLHTEGSKTGDWILMDYIDIVVHIFIKEERDHYQLDKLWGDAPQVNTDLWLLSGEEATM